MVKRYRILDWYVHQGHQYEFFKADHDFFLVHPNGSKPKWNEKHRPLGKNVHLISEDRAKMLNFDIVIIRTPIPSKRYRPFIHKGAAPIAVIQTTDPIWLPIEIRHVVWNSRAAMKARLGFYKNRYQHYIVHGYDPEEFKPLDLEKNGKVLTIANHFKKRAGIMGYNTWEFVRRKHLNCDVIGSRNEDIPGAIEHLDSLEELLKAYNEYSIYFNPTRNSAMPRSRAEAAMCGMPIVSTMHYDFKKYYRSGKDAFLSNDRKLLASYIKQLSESETMREDFGMRARELAIKHFHIDNYLLHWQQIFDKAIKDR
jgi:glycosyltransferase involved in cell wall biosynthesis